MVVFPYTHVLLFESHRNVLLFESHKLHISYQDHARSLMCNLSVFKSAACADGVRTEEDVGCSSRRTCSGVRTEEHVYE